MTARPWMPMYWGDYVADTAHLTTSEHGAYLLLIAHYWLNEGLPDDDARLARITRCTLTQWKKIKPTIQEFFDDGWKHKRIEFELTENRRISNAGRKGGIASGESRRKAKDKQNQRQNRTTVERPLNDQPTKREALQPQPQKKESTRANAPLTLDLEPEVIGEPPKAKFFREGKTILVSLGLSETRAGSVLGGWLKAKNDPEGILAALKYARDQCVVEPIGYVTRLLNSKDKPNAKLSLADEASQLASEARELERQAGIGR